MVARGFGPTDPTPGERVTAANAAMDAEYFTQQHTFRASCPAQKNKIPRFWPKPEGICGMITT